MTLRWLPNAICIARALLVAPLVVSLVRGEYVTALALLVVAGASDALDGFLAKTFNWKSRVGGLLDPAADKLLLVSVFLTLAHLDLIPAGVAAIVIGRDVIIVIGAVTYQMLIAPVQAEPSAISKLNTACQLGLVLFTITHAAFGWPPPISLLLLGAAVVFTSVVSGLSYMLRWGGRAWRQGRAPA